MRSKLHRALELGADIRDLHGLVEQRILQVQRGQLQRQPLKNLAGANPVYFVVHFGCDHNHAGRAAQPPGVDIGCCCSVPDTNSLPSQHGASGSPVQREYRPSSEAKASFLLNRSQATSSLTNALSAYCLRFPWITYSSTVSRPDGRVTNCNTTPSSSGNACTCARSSGLTAFLSYSERVLWRSGSASNKGLFCGTPDPRLPG